MPDLLEGLGDVDDGLALFARGECRRHPVHHHVSAATGEHLLRVDVRTARLDFNFKAGFLVEALGLGHEVAGELGLRHPLQLQRHLLGAWPRRRWRAVPWRRRQPTDISSCLSLPV